MNPLFLAALLALAPCSRAADRVEPVAAEAPLTPTPVVAPTLSAPAGSLDLPASALPSGAGTTIPLPAPASPAWAQATPQAYATAPQVVGRAVAVAPKPYFVAALVGAGVEPSLAKDLNDYLSAPGRHPGPQDMVYHGLHHSYDVAALAARLTETPEGRKLGRDQRVLLILAAALHDVDPRRDRVTPASVDRTFEYIDEDASTRQIIDRFAREYGFTTSQVKALIKKTDFAADPERMRQLDADAEARLAKEFRGAEWADVWARRLAFADKMASYVGSPEYADRQVRGLANEIKAPSLALAKGSAGFLRPLRDSPDYALLPESLKTNFEAVLRHYEDVAAHPENYADRFPPARGPPETDAVLYARAAAAQPVSPELDTQLARFNKTGLAVVSASGVMDPAVARALLRSVEGVAKTEDYELLERPGDMLRRSRPDYDGWKENRGGVRAFVARLEHLLNRAVPSENIAATKAGLRVEVPARGDQTAPGVPTPHVDGRYLTVTIALEGPGTDVWDDSSGKVEWINARTGEIVMQTAVDRAMRLGVPGTVHASPVDWSGRRVLLVINFVSDGYTNPRAGESNDYRDRRAAAVIRRWKTTSAKPKPKPTGLLGLLKGLLE